MSTPDRSDLTPTIEELRRHLKVATQGQLERFAVQLSASAS